MVGGSVGAGVVGGAAVVGAAAVASGAGAGTVVTGADVDDGALPFVALRAATFCFGGDATAPMMPNSRQMPTTDAQMMPMSLKLFFGFAGGPGGGGGMYAGSGPCWPGTQLGGPGGTGAPGGGGGTEAPGGGGGISMLTRSVAWRRS